MFAAGDTSEPAGARAVVTRSRPRDARRVPRFWRPNAEPARIGFDVVVFGAHPLARHRTLQDAVVAVLRDQDLTSTRIGLDRDRYGLDRDGGYPAAAAASSAGWLSNVLRLARAVKTEAEIESLRRVADLSETAARQALSLARPGSSIQAVCREHRRQVVAAMPSPAISWSVTAANLCQPAPCARRSLRQLRRLRLPTRLRLCGHRPNTRYR